MRGKLLRNVAVPLAIILTPVVSLAYICYAAATGTYNPVLVLVAVGVWAVCCG